METDKSKGPQFSFEEIPGRNQGVIYCHWPVEFKAYFFIRDLQVGRFILLPEHKNDKNSRLLEMMRSWFHLNYFKTRRNDRKDSNETGNIFVTGTS